MSRKGKPRGSYQRTDTILCEWCGEHKEVVHPEAKTCSPKCRTRLSRFRAETGFPPQSPPGRLTVRAALDLLILELFERERKRLNVLRAEAGLPWYKREGI